jgi:inorganic pyrophosphatase/CHAD domain-containing protein
MKTTQDLMRLRPRDPDSELVNVIIETPKGSGNKFKYDEKLQLFRLDKVLPLGAVFPFDFGFVPSTRAADGDPVDLLVLMDAPTFPGCLVAVHLLGVIKAEQTEQGTTLRNDRLIGVAETPRNQPDVRSLEELAPSRLDEIEHFFISYNQAEDRQFKPVGRDGPAAAAKLLADGVRQLQETGTGAEAEPLAVAGSDGEQRTNGDRRDARRSPPSRGGGSKSGRLRMTESGTRGVRRIIRKQMGKALEALGADPPLSDEAVHDVRKRLKKARAAMRLVRKALGPCAYDQENACFRDLARPLTEVRDAKVLVDTLDRLAEHSSERVDPRALDCLRGALLAHRREVRRRVLEGGDTVRLVKEALEAARERLQEWRVGRRDWSVLGDGLGRVYRSGRAAFAAAQEDPSVENLHEWRKQTKYLWHQLQLLQPVWPALLEALADQAHTLGDYLGDDHDLAVLRQKLQEESDRFSDRGAGDTIRALIDSRRAELQKQAQGLGRRLYEEKPKEFLDRVKKYWRTWRSEAPAAAEG